MVIIIFTDMKMTKQRKHIIETLKEVDTHPTADSVYEMVREKLPNVSMGTVYRNLKVLSKNGYIQRLDTVGLQKHYDGNTENHHHIVCEKCDRVSDLPVDMRVYFSINEEKVEGFKVTGYSFMMQGICPECMKEKGG